jgi:GDPmannose 4,6-dehydratase
MYLILQQDVAEDYVIATGVTTEIREFARLAFDYLGIQLSFEGEGVNEKGIIAAVDETKAAAMKLKVSQADIGREVIQVDPKYFRPTEVDLLIGDATKSRTKLNWSPKHSLQDLVNDMMQSDLHLMKKDEYLKDGGFTTMSYFE